MRVFAILLSLFSLHFEASASYKYVWGDFADFNQTPQTNGLVIEKEADIVLDSHGHIILNQSTVSFNFGNTAVRPSLADGKPFSMGLTFQAGTFTSTNGSLINLFSGKFYENDNYSEEMNISYNGNQLGNVSFNSGEMSQLTTKIDPSRDLTLFIDQTADNVLTISFYSGTDAITSVKFDGSKLNGGDLTEFIVGGADNSLVLKGLGIMVGDSANETWIQDYFRAVDVSHSVPEPSSSLLALLGSAVLLLYRKRAY